MLQREYLKAIVPPPTHHFKLSTARKRFIRSKYLEGSLIRITCLVKMVGKGKVGAWGGRFEELVGQAVRLSGCAGASEVRLAKGGIIECFERLVNVERDCVRDEEEFDMPVAVECFTIEEQGQLVRRIMKRFLPEKLWGDYVRWLFSILKKEERKMVMWSLWATGGDDGESKSA